MPGKDVETRYKPCARKRINGKKKRVSHLVILENTGRVVTPKEVVHHINGDSSDNRLKNLHVMTRSEHGKLHQPRDYSRFGVSAAEDKKAWSAFYRRAKGVPLRSYKITQDEYLGIKKLLLVGVSQAGVAKQYNLNQSTISRIKNGLRYKCYKEGRNHGRT